MVFCSVLGCDLVELIKDWGFCFGILMWVWIFVRCCFFVDSVFGEIVIDGDFIMGWVVVGVEGVDDVCVVYGFCEWGWW